MPEARIERIVGRRVWDSRGRPTVEAEIFLDNGASGRAIDTEPTKHRSAIPQLHRLVRSRGCAGRGDRAPTRAIVEKDFGFDRRPAT